MIFEGKSTSCCNKKLTWLSYIETWEKGRQMDEFTLCVLCPVCVPLGLPLPFAWSLVRK